MTSAHVEDARETIDRLRTSWAWLQLLVEPGRETSAGRVLSDVERDRADELAAAERSERWPRPRLGRAAGEDLLSRSQGDIGALATAPVPVRLRIVDVQVQVEGVVVAATLRVAAGLGVIWLFPGVLAALDWLDGSSGDGAWVASPGGVWWRCGAVDRVDGVALQTLTAELARADRTARAAAGVLADQVAPLPHRCPACGRRSLLLDYEGAVRSRWSVRCISEACRCAGPGCGCRQRVRYEGRHHGWGFGELTGPYGLWAAIRASTPRRPAVRSGRVGTGGRMIEGYETGGGYMIVDEPISLNVAEAGDGRYFATRHRARLVRAGAEALLADQPAGCPLTLDFSGVEAVTVTFADELVCNLVATVGPRVALTGMNADVAEAVERATTRRPEWRPE